MVQFDKIYIEGFNSIDKLNVPLGNGGLTFIKGVNGVGKSTLFNALYWCLYGKHPKGLTATHLPTWKQYRPKTYRGTRVTLSFTVGAKKYMVARHYKFKGTTKGVQPESELMLFEAAEKEVIEFRHLITEQHKKDIQGYLESGVLGMDGEAFKNALFFSQTAKRFIEESNTDKRSLFENIADLGWVDNCKDLAKTELTTLKAKQTHYESKYNGLNVELEVLSQQLETFENILTEFKEKQLHRVSVLQIKLQGIETTPVPSAFDLEGMEKTLKVPIERLTKEIKILQSKKVEFSSNVKQFVQMLQNAKNNVVEYVPGEYEAAVEKEKKDRLNFTEVQELHAKENSEFVNYEREIARLGKYLRKVTKDLEEVQDICPTCGEPINPGKLKEAKNALKLDIKKTKEQIEVLAIEQEKIRVEVKRLEKEKTQFKTTLETVRNSLTVLREKQDKQAVFNRQIADINSKLTFEKTKVKDTEVDIESKEITLERLQKEVADKLVEAEQNHIKEVETELQIREVNKGLVQKEIEEAKAEKPPTTNTDEVKARIKEISKTQKELSKKGEENGKSIEALEYWVKIGFGAMGV